MSEFLDIEGMPTKELLGGSDGDGDSMLWAGLICASGDLSPEDGIKNCQTKDGRLWRSPARKNKDTKNSFSRDMALGFLLYVSYSGNMIMLQDWIAYINKHKQLCPDATDDRAFITPEMRWQIRSVQTKTRAGWRFWLYVFISAVTAPKGYATHLNACHLLLQAIITKKRAKFIGTILHARQPQNPFFAWLAGIPNITIKEQLSTMRAQIYNSAGFQWAWERDDREFAWMNSMGWDFLFMENLLAREDII